MTSAEKLASLSSLLVITTSSTAPATVAFALQTNDARTAAAFTLFALLAVLIGHLSGRSASQTVGPLASAATTAVDW